MRKSGSGHQRPIEQKSRVQFISGAAQERASPSIEAAPSRRRAPCVQLCPQCPVTAHLLHAAHAQTHRNTRAGAARTRAGRRCRSARWRRCRSSTDQQPSRTVADHSSLSWGGRVRSSWVSQNNRHREMTKAAATPNKKVDSKVIAVPAFQTRPKRPHAQGVAVAARTTFNDGGLAI